MQEQKQQVRVQIGNFDDPMNDALIDWIKEAFESEYALEFGSCFHGHELLELAEEGEADIFILFMNNIRFPDSEPVEDRLEACLELITKIKTTRGRPVIAMCGWEEDSSLIKRAKLAADFYFSMPCKADALIEAFEKCLEMLDGFDGVPRSAGHTRT